MTPKLVAIKRTPIGLFDTLKIRLDHVADQNDLDALSANSPWKRKAGAQGPVFVNRENGMKVICYQDLVMVEASVPRVLGLPSDMQHLVRVVDLMEALHLMMSVMPKTTSQGKAAGQEWFVTRIDLAVNFIRPEGDLFEAVRLLRFPKVQRGATLFDDSGVAYYGGKFELVVYRTDKRPPRGKLKAGMRHQKFVRRRVWMLRCELRFMNPMALAQLVQHLESDPHGLPVGIRATRDAKIEVHRVRIDYERLHRILATYVDSLCAELPDLDGKRATPSVFRAYALAKHGTKFPDLWAAAVSGLSERQVRTIKIDVAGQMLRMQGIRLVDLIWKRPRISADLYWKLAEQMGRALWG